MRIKECDEVVGDQKCAESAESVPERARQRECAVDMAAAVAHTPRMHWRSARKVRVRSARVRSESKKRTKKTAGAGGNNYTKSYLLIADTNTHTHTRHTPSANTFSLFMSYF